VKIRDVLFPKRSDEEKIKRQLLRHKLMTQAFYLAILIAFASAFFKMFRNMPPGSYLAEEIIIIVSLFYYALRSVSLDATATKNLRAKEAHPLLLLFSLISGVLTALLTAAAIYAQGLITKAAAFTLASWGICIVAGSLSGFLFYLGIRFFCKIKKKA